MTARMFYANEVIDSERRGRFRLGVGQRGTDRDGCCTRGNPAGDMHGVTLIGLGGDFNWGWSGRPDGYGSRAPFWNQLAQVFYLHQRGFRYRRRRGADLRGRLFRNDGGAFVMK